MKTTVVGVFPRADDARRVLSQLVASTLDLDAVRVFHQDSETQRGLAAEAGLKADRTVPAGIVAGALLGMALGFGWGLSPDLPLAQAGPLFLAAVGLLLGGVAGGVVSALSDSLPVPKEQLPELESEVERGATVVLVRTDSLPTARAIRDLFQAAGSEMLEPIPGADNAGEEAGSPAAALAGETAATMAGDDAGDAADPHAPFVPPWRRLWGGGKSATTESAAADPAEGASAVDAPVAPWERAAPAHAEPAQYQPPERADVAEDAAPRRRRKADAVAETASPEEEPPADAPVL